MADWRDHFTFLSQGAIVQHFKVGGRDIVLNFDDPATYASEHSPFFGETIGRCANRIANARIESLNGKIYDLPVNNGPNTLHGGEAGWGKRTFDGPIAVTRAGREAVEFRYRSVDGEEGFPGDVTLSVWYYPEVKVVNGKEQVSLEMEYEAELAEDKVEETVINVCNHSYINITGNSTVEGTVVKLSTALHQETDKHDIPTGQIKPFPAIVANKDFTLGETEPDIDHCFVLDAEPGRVPIDTRGLPLRKLCDLHHVGNKLKLEVHSTEPAFQFYTGKYVDVPAIDGQAAKPPRSGICIEASRYVNAINDDRWRDMVVLKKGECYGSRTIYTATQL